jgi:hypothetical protein
VQTGYGFIHFPLTPDGIASSLQAVNCMNGFVLDAVKYSCKVSRTLEEYFQAQQQQQQEQQQSSQPSQSSSYGTQQSSPTAMNPFVRPQEPQQVSFPQLSSYGNSSYNNYQPQDQFSTGYNSQYKENTQPVYYSDPQSSSSSFSNSFPTQINNSNNQNHFSGDYLF